MAVTCAVADAAGDGVGVDAVGGVDGAVGDGLTTAFSTSGFRPHQETARITTRMNPQMKARVDCFIRNFPFPVGSATSVVSYRPAAESRHIQMQRTTVTINATQLTVIGM